MRMDMLKFILSCCTAILCSVLSANEYLNTLLIAEKWIDKTYSSQFANKRAKEKLKIIDDSDLTEKEKIELIRKKFPEAFKNAPLIYRPLVSWRIHSLALGYDIQSTSTETAKTVDIEKELSNRKSGHDSSTQQTTRVNTQASAGVSARTKLSFNPFKWFSGSAQVDLSASYALGKNSSRQRTELWSQAQQMAFSRESRVITEMIKQTNIKNFHLTFTVTVTNHSHSKNSMSCDLSKAYIPLYKADGTSYNINAYPYSMPSEKLQIRPKHHADIKFRAELDTSSGRALAAYMANNTPRIDILKNGGSLHITSQDGADVLTALMEQTATTPVKFHFPEFSGTWDIRQRHTADNATVTLKEALLAISKDIESNFGKKDLFDSNFTMISDVPFGNFAKSDKDLRYIALLQIGDTVYSQLSSNLDKKISDKECIVWIVDLDDSDTCKKLHQSLRKEIFENIKNLAEGPLFGKGVPIAQLHLANMYREGFYTQKDETEAVKWYKKAADQELSVAQFLLGLCYEQGIGVKKDDKKAVECYKNAAKQRHVKAQYNLGLCYQEGRGVKKDDKEAEKWFKEAEKNGFVAPHTQPTIPTKTPQTNAEKLLLEAKQGIAEAQFKLGCCYQDGKLGLTLDRALACHWFEKAAKQRHVKAQYNLGLCYLEGRGVERDERKAVKWFKDAANQGHVGAQYNLGLCYEKGYGVKKDAKEAVKRYKKAAEQGYARAQRELGLGYINGRLGLKPDRNQACYWFKKAAEQKFEDAKKLYIRYK